MFITLTQLQNKEATLLQSTIDNTDGRLYVALRGFHYEVGYRNVDSSVGFLWRPKNSGILDGPQSIRIPPGLYYIEDLSKFFTEEIPGSTLEITEATNLIKLNIPESSGEIKLNSDLRQILGINEKRWFSGEYEGDRPVNLLIHKWLYVYLDQLSTSSNIVDGAPSTLLAIVPAATRGITDLNPHNPMYKRLEVGHIHQLNLHVLDEEGAIVQNRKRPITAVLEIREAIP